MQFTPPKTKRNMEIYLRWKAGEDRYKLIKEYDITMARFYAITKRIGELIQFDIVEAKIPVDKVG